MSGELLHCQGVTVDSAKRITAVEGHLAWASGAFVTLVETSDEQGWNQYSHVQTKVHQQFNAYTLLVGRACMTKVCLVGQKIHDTNIYNTGLIADFDKMSAILSANKSLSKKTKGCSARTRI